MRLKSILKLAALGCALAGPAWAATPVQVWETYTDRTRLLAPAAPLSMERQPERDLNIVVDPGQRFQEMVGIGANITDASAWLIQNKMNPAQRKAFMEEMFGPAPGLGFSFTRLTIGASDFSLHHYSLNDMPKGQRDPGLEKFSIAPMRAEVLPVLKQAMAINPQLKVMASPWSAPAWMKTNDSLIKGSLRPDAYEVFARYLVKFVDAMQAEGVPMYALTLQNEPHFEPNDYPGMRLDSPARAKIIGEHLGPMLAQRKDRVRILDWDHNWDEPQAPLHVLADKKANPYVAGVAWHCYVGDPSAQLQVQAAYPDKEAYFTECAGGEGNAGWRETLPWNVRNLMIGSIRGWSKGVLMWNLALDENYGPHLGGCADCRGVVIINSKTGEVTRNLDYYALAHVSRFIRPGAVRIGSSTNVGRLESVAFQNKDDGSLVLVVLNGAANRREFSVSVGQQVFRHSMPGASVATFVWKP